MCSTVALCVGGGHLSSEGIYIAGPWLSNGASADDPLECQALDTQLTGRECSIYLAKRDRVGASSKGRYPTTYPYVMRS